LDWRQHRQCALVTHCTGALALGVAVLSMQLEAPHLGAAAYGLLMSIWVIRQQRSPTRGGAIFPHARQVCFLIQLQLYVLAGIELLLGANMQLLAPFVGSAVLEIALARLIARQRCARLVHR
jgi:hypothetical protein